MSRPQGLRGAPDVGTMRLGACPPPSASHPLQASRAILGNRSESSPAAPRSQPAWTAPTYSSPPGPPSPRRLCGLVPWQSHAVPLTPTPWGTGPLGLSRPSGECRGPPVAALASGAPVATDASFKPVRCEIAVAADCVARASGAPVHRDLCPPRPLSPGAPVHRGLCPPVPRCIASGVECVRRRHPPAPPGLPKDAGKLSSSHLQAVPKPSPSRLEGLSTAPPGLPKPSPRRSPSRRAATGLQASPASHPASPLTPCQA
jgi:hypothetical protein